MCKSELCRNFAAVKLTTKRHIASWSMLAVFVLMLILSSLHVHYQDTVAEQDCKECVHHHCNGHLTQFATSMHQCVLCQFLTLPFLIVAIASFTIFHRVSKVAVDARQRHVAIGCLGIIGLRAPPYFFV